MLSWPPWSCIDMRFRHLRIGFHLVVGAGSDFMRHCAQGAEYW